MRTSRVFIRCARVPRGALAVAALTLTALAAARPAGGQVPADSRWLPWIGCWEAAPTQPTASQPPSGHVCVHAKAGAPGVTVATINGGRVTSTREIVADGARHQVSEGGCSGWEEAVWSRDAHRIFRRGELQCEGGARRNTGSVIAFLPNDEWVEIQGAGAGANTGVRTLRYRASAAPLAAANLLPKGKDLAIETGRTAAAVPLLTADVIEASRYLQPRVLQALVYLRGNGYDLDSRVVRELATSRVPADVIDLMVALSYPGDFTIDGGTARVAMRDNPTDGSGGDRGRGRYPGGWGCYDLAYGGYYGGYPGYGYYGGYMAPGWIYSYPLGYGYGYGSGYRGYYDPCYGPYGGYGGYYGGGYWGGGYWPGGVVVSRGNGSTGGKAVNGKGYTRPEGTEGSGRTAHPKSGSGSGSGSVGGQKRPSVSPGGYSGGHSGGGSSGGNSGGSSGSSNSGGTRTASPKH